MIRRGLWFTAGAVAGIAGYRRAARAARTLLPEADLLAPLGRRIAGPARRALGSGQHLAYRAAPQAAAGPRNRAARAPAAGRALAPGRAPTAGRAAGGQGAAAGTAAFVRDVQAGMADYLDARRSI